MGFGCVITPFLRFHYYPSFVFECQVFLYFSTMVNISAASSLMGREDPVGSPFFQAPNHPNPQLPLKFAYRRIIVRVETILSTAANEEQSDSNVEMAQIENHVHQHSASSTSEDAFLEEAMKQVGTSTWHM